MNRDFIYFDGKRVNMVEEPLPLAPTWLSSQTAYDPNTQLWKNTLQLYPNTDGHTHGYLVYKKTTPGSQFVPLFNGGAATSTTTTLYDDTLLPLGTGCTYKVVAVDYAGNHGPESGERFITAGDSTPTAAPTSLSATPGNARVTLTWVGPPSAVDLAGYYVYRKLVSGSYGSPLNSIALTVPNYTDLAVVNGTTYYYVVKAVDTAGNLSAQSSQVSAKPKAMLQGSNIMVPGSDSAALLAEISSPAEHIQDDLMSTPYARVGQVAGSNSYFLHSDHLGSLRLITNVQGAVVTSHKYLPFGEEIQPMRTLNPYHYAGYERDGESGLDYVRARFYASGRSRWLSPDPLGAGYIYSGMTPLNALDPSGLLWVLFPTCPSGSVCVFLPAGPGYPDGGFAPIGQVEIVFGREPLFHRTNAPEPPGLTRERMVAVGGGGKRDRDESEPCEEGYFAVTASAGLGAFGGYAGPVTGTQTDNVTGEQYAVAGATFGADAGLNVFEIPNVSFTTTKFGTSGAGTFSAFQLNFLLATAQYGNFHSFSTGKNTSFLEVGAVSSLLGANYSSGVIVPAGQGTRPCKSQ